MKPDRTAVLIAKRERERIPKKLTRANFAPGEAITPPGVEVQHLPGFERCFGLDGRDLRFTADRPTGGAIERALR